mmetsp:Transcript_791/g.2893  ORF Transcript_791/g.2893 Transcript_791/m.2893 type:complete len:100 (+) Transcript_791:2846-3145(+)
MSTRSGTRRAHRSLVGRDPAERSAESPSFTLLAIARNEAVPSAALGKPLAPPPNPGDALRPGESPMLSRDGCGSIAETAADDVDAVDVDAVGDIKPDVV